MSWRRIPSSGVLAVLCAIVLRQITVRTHWLTPGSLQRALTIQSLDGCVAVDFIGAAPATTLGKFMKKSTVL